MSQSIKISGADLDNDPGKILLQGNMNITSPTNYVPFDILRL